MLIVTVLHIRRLQILTFVWQYKRFEHVRRHQAAHCRCWSAASSSSADYRIPHGVKSNVYFVVENGCNVLRRQAGKQAAFDDDCGVWKSQRAGSAKFPYSDGTRAEYSSLRRIFWVAGQQKYCRETKAHGKRTHVPLEPQPDTNHVLTLIRYYAILAASSRT